jgi:hypothetical protein
MATISRLKSDLTNYSRNDPQRNVVTAICYLTNVTAGDVVNVNLVRGDGFGVVGTATATLSAGQTTARLAIPLESCLDTLYPKQKIYRAKAGSYTLADAAGPAVSAPFTISVVSLRRFRDEICKGLPLLTGETIGPLEPLKNITGVTITSVRPNTFADIYPFVYTHATTSLSWAGGAAVDVSEGGHFRLIDANQHWWVSVNVDDTLLPVTDATDSIPFDEQEMTDEALLQEITYATNEVAGKLQMYVEPTQVASPFILDYLAHPNNSLFTPEPTTFADVNAIAVNYQAPPTETNWLSFSLPYRGLIQIEALLGMMNDTTVLDIDQGWWQWSERNALVQLVPRQGAAIAWIYYNVFYYSFLLGAYDYVPNFWHYKATVGMRDLKERRMDVLQAIEYLAGVKILRQAGLHAKPGYVTESLNRDGVSQSIAYSTGKGGVYNAIIDSYDEWLKENLGKLRNRVAGYQVKLI